MLLLLSLDYSHAHASEEICARPQRCCVNISKELMTIKKNANLEDTGEDNGSAGIKWLMLVGASLIWDLSLVVYFVFSVGT